MKNFLLMIVATLMLCGVVRADEDIVKNGDFQTDANSDGKPDGWELPKGFSVVKEGDQTFLKLEGTGQLSKWFKVDPEWKTIKFSGKIKCKDVVRGAKGWQTACVAFDFRNDKGKHVGEWVAVPKVSGTKDWETFSKEYKIPTGATKIKIDLANFGKSGTVEFDDISLVPVK